MATPPTGSNTTVSLVLGGGGARGLAHVGVIDSLTERGYDVRSISGCSIGALVGGVYATGRLDDFRGWVTALGRLDVVRLLDLSFHSTGLFKGERVIAALRDLVGEWNIEDLPLAFTAVATDLYSGREVWLDRGPLFDAVRASIAIPTVFTPHVIGGRRLVDGSLVDPVPIAPTLRDATDLTVAVNSAARPRDRWTGPVRAQPEPDVESESYRSRIAQFVRDLTGRDEEEEEQEERDEDLGLFEVLSRSMDTMQDLIARHQLAVYSPDVLIEIPRDACQAHEFHRAAEMIELGRQIADRTFAAREG